MAIAALVIYLIWGALAFGLRTWVQWRRTGDTGFRGGGLAKGTVQWWARVLFTGALFIGAAGPIAALAGLPAITALEHAAVQTAGVALAGTGVVAGAACSIAPACSARTCQEGAGSEQA